MIKGVFAVAALMMVWSAADAAACAIQVTYPVQVMARQATAIAEAKALDAVRTFEVLRTFRGSPPPRIALGIRSNCDDPTTPGQRYLLFVHPRQTHVVPVTEEALRFLEAPQRVTRRELVRMLQKWSARRVSDEEMAEWVGAAVDSGEVDDWTALDGSAFSPTLGTLLLLDGYFERRPCSVDHLRTRITPRLLRLLRKRIITEGDVELLERDRCLD